MTSPGSSPPCRANFQAITRYQLWKPAAGQLEAAGYDFGRLKGILLTHAHWDHMSGIPDFPGLPVMVTARDKAFFGESQAPRRFGPPGFGPQFAENPFNWQVFDFEGGPYLGFARSHDVHGDGSVVCVPAPGHTPGSIVIFVTLPRNVRYALVGDLVWQREGLTRRLERPWRVKLLGDADPEGTRQNLLKMVSVMQRIPEIEAMTALAHAGATRVEATLPPHASLTLQRAQAARRAGERAGSWSGR